MDEIDKANERAQELLEESLAKRKEQGPPPCGFCCFCQAPVPKGHRWCDIDCRQDWEREQQVKKDKAGRYYDDGDKNAI